MDLPGAYGRRVGGALPPAGRAGKVGLGGGEYRVGVDAGSRPGPADQEVNRDGIKGQQAVKAVDLPA